MGDMLPAERRVSPPGLFPQVPTTSHHEACARFRMALEAIVSVSDTIGGGATMKSIAEKALKVNVT